MLGQLDLQLMHRFQLDERLGLTLMATIFNLFDQDGPIDYFQWRAFFENVVISESDYFRGFDTEQLIAKQGIQGDPRFMMNEFFRPPRSIRLGMRLSF